MSTCECTQLADVAILKFGCLSQRDDPLIVGPLTSNIRALSSDVAVAHEERTGAGLV